MSINAALPARTIKTVSDAFNQLVDAYPELTRYAKLAAWICAGAGVIKFCVNYQHRKAAHIETLPDGTRIARVVEETVFSWGFGNNQRHAPPFTALPAQPSICWPSRIPSVN